MRVSVDEFVGFTKIPVLPETQYEVEIETLMERSSAVSFIVSSEEPRH